MKTHNFIIFSVLCFLLGGGKVFCADVPYIKRALVVDVEMHRGVFTQSEKARYIPATWSPLPIEKAQEYTVLIRSSPLVLVDVSERVLFEKKPEVVINKGKVHSIEWIPDNKNQPTGRGCYLLTIALGKTIPDEISVEMTYALKWDGSWNEATVSYMPYFENQDLIPPAYSKLGLYRLHCTEDIESEYRLKLVTTGSDIESKAVKLTTLRDEDVRIVVFKGPTKK